MATLDNPNAKKEGKLSRSIELLVVIVVLTFSAYTFYELNGKSFDITDRQVLLIVSGSMDGDVTGYDIDSFPKDTMVMVKHISEEDKRWLRIGDVITFWYDNVLDNHRIIEVHIADGYVVTQGDNANYPENVSYQRIEGQVVGTNHILGMMASFAKHYYVSLIILIVATVASWEIYTRYIREDGQPIGDE